MIEIRSNNEENKVDCDEVVAVSAGVKCPVCLEVILISKSTNYFLLSNFHKHIRVHLKEEMKKKAAKGKRKLRSKNTSKVKRSSSRFHNATKIESDASSDSGDIAAISKEMEKNFAAESDGEDLENLEISDDDGN